MDNRTLDTPECWNKEPIKRLVKETTELETVQQRCLPMAITMDVGRIGCNGCNGDVCTAAESRTTLRTGGGVPQVFGRRSLEETEGFNREKPEGFGEAKVIKIDRAA